MTTASPSNGAAIADPAVTLEQVFSAAIVAALGDEYAGTDPLIRPSQKAEHGDYQSNVAMPLAKRAKMNPRELATTLLEHVTPALADLADPPEIAGPGFINIRLRPEALGGMLETMARGDLGIEPDADPHPVVIDLCGVNVAKQMHVGHLRSTIIGDALARTMERRGRAVHRENHLGDWGLPIAMVLHELRANGTNLDTLTLPDLDAAYRGAQLTTKADMRGLTAAHALYAGPHRIAELEEQNAGAATALDAAKDTLVRLQRGDDDVVADWHKLIDCTLNALYEALGLLNVKLGPENNRGESFYRERLPVVLEDFIKSGFGIEDDGAIVVRFEDRERPMIIRKSDGGYLYATTDLAAIRYRVQELDADRVIYVVDARQRAHFRDVFDGARLIGWATTGDDREARLDHVAFGAVLGTDKKPLKTRSGENVTLMSLLEEAIDRGTAEVKARAADPHAPTHGLDDDALRTIGTAVGIGAVKYADLSSDLIRDYVFDMDRMVAFEGHTGPYLQYAHARICSIFSKAGVEPDDLEAGTITLSEPTERQLALTLLRYGPTVTDVTQSLEPHRLCTYLYDLAEAYSRFYQQCSVLKADDEATKASRLRLCDLVRRVLADGLGLLGIDSPRSM